MDPTGSRILKQSEYNWASNVKHRENYLRYTDSHSEDNIISIL